MTRLTHDGMSEERLKRTGCGVLVAFAIVAFMTACSGPSTPEPVPAERPDASPAIDLAGLLAELEARHSPTLVATTLEVLPVLQPYFEDERVTDGKLAAMRHWDRLAGEEQAKFAARLRRVHEYCERMQQLTADLPNGYHDVAYALPESKALYLPILDDYGLDPRTATSYDIASSVSTYHESSIQVAIASLLAELSEERRADYFRRFRAVAEAARAAGER